MKRFYLTLGLATAALAAVVSCSKDLEIATRNSVADAVTLGAVIEKQADGTASKTSLNYADKTILWSEGDALDIMADGGTIKYVLTEGAGTQQCIFAAEDPGAQFPSTTGNYYAVYPYSACGTYVSEGRINVTLSNTQNYVEGSFANGANLSVAKFSEDDISAKNNLYFKNACGVLKLQFYTDEAINVKSIMLIENSSKALCGEAEMSINQESAVPTLSFSKGASVLTMNMGTGIDLSTDPLSPTSFFFVVPAGVFDAGFRAIIKGSDDKMYEASTTVANTIKRSTILAMPACKITEVAASEGIDLSENGTSNCYLITESSHEVKTYKFKADVMGNGVSGKINDEDEVTFQPYMAEELWSTVNTATAPAADFVISDVKFNFTDNYITFKAKGNAGNALIAAKDANGTILWSWHIWCMPGMDLSSVSTESAPTSLLGPAIDGRYILDRNLGALSAEVDNNLTAGLMYQSGRKDPFPGVCALKSTNEQAFRWHSSLNKNVVIKAVSKEEASKTPLTWYYSSTYKAWQAPLPENNWLVEKKTIYDPCPIGYKVCPASTIANGGYSYNPTTNGMTLKMKNTSNPEIETPFCWVPHAAYISSKSGALNNANFLLAVSDPVNSSTKRVTCVYFYLENTTKYKIGEGDQACGYPVRCCKEDTPSQSE